MAKIPRIIFHIERNYALRGIAMYIAQKSFDGTRIAYLQTATFQEQDATVIPDAEPLIIDFDDARILMDALWDAGIRPTDTKDRSEVVKAKTEHIADLRDIVNKLLIPKGLPNGK